jgi:NitT/TauT family transport system permease protein
MADAIQSSEARHVDRLPSGRTSSGRASLRSAGARTGTRRGALGVRAAWWVARLATFAAVLAAWQIAVDRGLISSFFFSTPKAIGSFLQDYISSGEFATPVWTTVKETVLAFLLGSISGMLVGVLLASVKPLKMLLAPFLTALNALPRVALAPLFILWFGIGEPSKIYLGASLVFFIVLINTESGILAVEREYLTVARAFGASRLDTLRMITLPSIVPAVFSGLRVGLIYALLGVVTAEMVAARTGLGQAVIFYSSVFNTAGVLGVLFILALVALSINEVMALAEQRLVRWRE